MKTIFKGRHWEQKNGPTSPLSQFSNRNGVLVVWWIIDVSFCSYAATDVASLLAKLATVASQYLLHV